MSNDFEKSFKVRLIDKIDEARGSTFGNALIVNVNDHAELDHDSDRVRIEVDDVIDQIKSDHWTIESADDVRDGFDEWMPTELIYTSDIEEAVCRAGISECFDVFEGHMGEPAGSLNDLHYVVERDLKNAIEAAFVELAEEVEEESEEE